MDIVAIGSNDEWVASAKLDPDSHWAAFGQVSEDKFPLLGRLSDYYEDAVFAPNEIEKAIAELYELESSLENSVSRMAFESVRTVFDTARTKSLRVEALAD